MSNFTDVAFPPLPVIPTHFVNKNETMFVCTRQEIMTYGLETLKKLPNNISLDSNTQFIVVEEVFSLIDSWFYIKYDDKFGYVPKSSVFALQGTKPFLQSSNSSSLQEDWIVPPIDWREQPSNIVYADRNIGKICLHLELPYENITDKEQLKQLIKEGYYIGLSNIFRESKKRWDREYIERLTNTFYNFAQAEEYYFPIRECSTLRVFVNIPMKYLDGGYLEPSSNTPTATAASPAYFASYIASTSENIKPIKSFELVYNNYGEFINHITGIQQILRELKTVYTSNGAQWIIDPSTTGLNFDSEISNLETFKELVNKLIIDNIYGIKSSNAFAVVTGQALTEALTGRSWDGKLKLIINTNDLLLSAIQFAQPDFSNPQNLRSLDLGYYTTLKSDALTNKTTINYLLKVPKTSILEEYFKNYQNLFTPDDGLSQFLTTNHYPIITSIQRQSLDLLECTRQNYRLVKDIVVNQKSPAVVRQFNNLREESIRNQAENEGDIFTKSSRQFSKDKSRISDRRLRLLLGLDPWSTDKPLVMANQIIEAASLFDIQRWLLEALKCGTLDFDPQEFASLLEQYQKVKKQLDKIALATVCNPYLGNALKLYNTFQLPIIPTRNPNKSLIEELTKLLVKIINDGVVLAIRKRLTDSFRNCAEDKPRNRRPNNITNNLDPNEGQNDPAVDDLLDDLYGGIKDEDGNIDNDARNAAKQKLKDLLDDLSNCLSTNELCALLTGKVVADSVIDAIISYVARKHNTPDAEINLANKFNNRQAIIDIFLRIGQLLGDDLQICEDVLTTPQINKNVLCDDGTFDNLRKGLLSDKGIEDDLLDDMLKDIKDKKRKNLDELLKFLDSDEPFNFDVPSVLCKDGIPPPIKVSPAMSSFKSLLNTLFKDVYDTFDQESKSWYKTTYSIYSNAPKIVNYDSATGQFTPNKTDKLTGEQLDNAVSSSGEILPYYIFNDVTNSINKTYNEYTTYQVFLDGKKQQKLDVEILGLELRANVRGAEESLRRFLGALNETINTYLSIFAIRGLTQASVQIQNLWQTNAGVYDKVEGSINEILGDGAFGREFKGFLRSKDMFYMNNIENVQNMAATADNKSLIANALLMADAGIPIYLNLMNFLVANRSKVENFINYMSNYLRPSSQGTNIPGEQVSTFSSEVNNILSIAIEDFNSVKNIYEVVIGSGINYPSFDLTMNFGIKDYSGQLNYDDENLYDISNVVIKKNDNNYLRFGGRRKLKASTTNYILNDLKFPKNDLNKKKVFDSFLNYKKQQFASSEILVDNSVDSFKLLESLDTNNIYFSLDKYMFDKMKSIIVDPIKNKFSTFYEKPVSVFAPPPELADTLKGVNNKTLKRMYTQDFGEMLVLQQTEEQKACNVRPHYLDIDEIKDDIVSQKEKLLCSIEVVKDDKIASNLPISTSELESLETSDTQNIILNGTFRLAIRTYLHDILLRSINLFSYYNPQSLRKDETFVEYMALQVESEMRGADNTFFSLMLNHFQKMKKLEENNQQLQNIKVKDLFKDTVKKELHDYVLPKLTKRIWEDTNKKLYGDSKNIVLHYAYDDAISDNKCIFEKDNSIYLRTANDKAIKIFDGNIESFRSSPEYDLLFGYIFPQEQYLSYFFMISCLSTSTRRKLLNTFKQTKASIRKIAMITQSNGSDIVADPANAQDIINNNADNILENFILESLFRAPYLIFKGYAEIAEPNIAVSSGIYKVLNAIVPETPSVIIPGASVGLLFAGLFPINPIVYALYLIGFFWYEDKTKERGNVLKDLLNNALDNTPMNCESVKDNNPDKIVLNEVNKELLYTSAGKPIG